MLNRTDDKINIEIMDNELSATDWELFELAWEVRWWLDFFNIAFFREQPVPLPVISFQRTRITNLGSYRIGRNSMGLRENINLNRAHLSRPLWEILSTLLHELCHVFEYQYFEESARTNNWYHKKGFRKKLASFGIITDNRGVHLSVTDPFVHLLRQHGVVFEKWERPGKTISLPKRTKPKGKSKLKKWACACTNVRVGIKDFEAQCLKCGERFVEQ